MKSTTEKDDKLKLCESSMGNANTSCSETHKKFAIKHINVLFGATYFAVIVIAFLLIVYIHYVGEHKSEEIQFNFEKFLEHHLIKNKEYNYREKSFYG